MRTALLVALLFWIQHSTGGAQETTGRLAGRVMTENGVPLAEVEIAARGPRLLGSREGRTTSDGNFTLPAIPAGSYTVTIRRLGYRPIRFEQVPVRLGNTTSLGDIRLELQAVELPELIVSGERAFLDPASATAGIVLPGTTFEALPTDRTYLSIATMAPQANVSYIGDGLNIAGATGLENAYFIDGVNVTDPYLGATATNLPYNFVQEIQVKTSGFEPEYGRALGGIVNVVTPSGGNELGGQVFGFFTNSGLAGARRRGLVDADLTGGTEYDAGLSLGGPVVRDRAWFFAAYSAARMTEDITVSDYGTQESSRRSHLFAGKLTWQPQKQTTLVLSAFGDPTKRRAIGPFTIAFGTPTTLENIDPFLSEVRSGGISVSLQGRHQATQRLLFEAALSRVNRRDGEEGATTRGRSEPLYIDNNTGRWAGGFGHVQDWRSRRTAAKVTGTALLATHTVKIGAEYEDNRLDQFWLTTYPGIVLVPIPPSDEWWTGHLDFSGQVRNRVLSLFAQDSWLVTKWLRLNFGLRWDGQRMIGGGNDRATQTVSSPLQPRLGLVTHWGSQTLSFAYGRYYEQLPTAFSIFNYGSGSAGLVTYIYDEDPASGAGPRDSLYSPPAVASAIPGLNVPYVSEWTAGYNRQFAQVLKLGARVVYRSLGEAIDNGAPAPFAEGFTGNPGRGNLDFLPRFQRHYTALELTIAGRMGRQAELSASYVHSRSWGNYPGLYDSDVEGENPHYNLILDFPEQVPNSWGQLPNDRPHVFKLFGSAAVTQDLVLGLFASWQSGTPLNELGAIRQLPPFDIFLRPRGSAGRAPSLWDLNFRSTYALPIRAGSIESRVILDVLHIGSPRRAVSFDQVHYQDVDEGGNQIVPNPNYLRPTRYQPPMSARLGLVADF